MPWIKKEYDCGNCIVVVKEFCTRYGSKGKITYNTTNERGEVSEKTQRYLEKRAKLKADVIVNRNFGKGDYFITFTFGRGKLPDSKDELDRIRRNYFDQLRKVYKEHGVELKYYGRLHDEGVRPHFHYVFNNEFNVKDFPEWKYGTPKIEILDRRRHHTIGSYFERGTTKEDKEVKTLHYGGKTYCSQNLYRPKPKITKMKGSRWRDVPKNRQGYYVDKSTLENGYTENPYNRGTYRYQSYVLVKSNEKERLNI